MPHSADKPDAFARLLTAAAWLRSNALDEDVLREFQAYVREQIRHVESLSLFMMDVKAGVLFRHSPLGAVVLDGRSAPDIWIQIEAAFAILAGNKTRIIVTQEQQTQCYEIMAVVKRDAGTLAIDSTIEFITSDASVGSGSAFTYRQPVVRDQQGHVSLASILPPLSHLVQLEVQDLQYLTSNYGVTELMDEFDVLPDVQRDILVQQRTRYLLWEARHTSSFYKATLASEVIADAPCINGTVLSEHTPPYGAGILTDSSYAIVFASGGTTGRPKFVYRSAWEDSENARYLGKGLRAAGIGRADVVANCLSAGFWGGLHVFNLALSFTGCGVIPLSPDFPNGQSVDFLQKLKPTAILAMPSWLLSLAEHVEREGIVLHIQKVITGGEILFPAAAEQIRRILGVTEFLSTGYTSNETGAIAFRCRQAEGNVFHLHENMQHVQITPRDGSAAGDGGDGALGRIVATNLNRTLMPVIRYEIGDLGRLVARRCGCGRTLRLLELHGRCDGRVRLGGEDLLVEDVAAAVARVPGLSVHFSLAITKSARQRDVLTVTVEASAGGDGAAAGGDGDPRASALVDALGTCTPLVWSEEKGAMERPVIVIVPHGNLPRNPRTGKITLVVDNRT